MKLLAPFLLSILTAQVTIAQQSIEQIFLMQQVPKIYQVNKITNTAIQIDGLNHEDVWKNTPWTDSFVDIEGIQKPKPLYDTKVKMLWDDQYLYIYAKLEEPHIWGDIKDHDAIIYHNNDFELFFKPYENQSTYFEIEVNTLNTILDLLMNKPYRFGGEAMLQWDAKGLKSAIHIEGTNNDPNDEDKYWAIEMAIPFKAINNFGRKPTPTVGDYWRMNFSRVQWQHEVINGQYTRKKENDRLLAEDNWVWSPIGLIDMHYPERWGFIQFIDSINKHTSSLPKSYPIERFTWNIYYLQNIYKQKNNRYSSLQSVLDPKSSILKDSDQFSTEITLNQDSTFFIAKIKDLKNNITTSVDCNGNYTINYDK